MNCATGASNYSGMNASHGCHGGDTFGAYAYMATAGVPDESCQNYEATGDGAWRINVQPAQSLQTGVVLSILDVPCWRLMHFAYLACCSHCMPLQLAGTQCTPANICRNCAPGKGCWAVEHPPLYFVEEHGVVLGEANMMAEIAARGPITATIAVTEVQTSRRIPPAVTRRMHARALGTENG